MTVEQICPTNVLNLTCCELCCDKRMILMMYRCNVMLLNRTLYTKWDILCSFEAVICHSWTVKVPCLRSQPVAWLRLRPKLDMAYFHARIYHVKVAHYRRHNLDYRQDSLGHWHEQMPTLAHLSARNIWPIGMIRGLHCEHCLAPLSWTKPIKIIVCQDCLAHFHEKRPTLSALFGPLLRSKAYIVSIVWPIVTIKGLHCQHCYDQRPALFGPLLRSKASIVSIVWLIVTIKGLHCQHCLAHCYDQRPTLSALLRSKASIVSIVWPIVTIKGLHCQHCLVHCYDQRPPLSALFGSLLRSKAYIVSIVTIKGLHCQHCLAHCYDQRPPLSALFGPLLRSKAYIVSIVTIKGLHCQHCLAHCYDQRPPLSALFGPLLRSKAYIVSIVWLIVTIKGLHCQHCLAHCYDQRPPLSALFGPLLRPKAYIVC